ncbi:AP-4 complex subunit mu-like, partial [Trifolium medium]|nr:AP-4 complex subunit mu-like [Trifolium medium]
MSRREYDTWKLGKQHFLAYAIVSFELEPGASGQTTDFKEANKRLEWSLKKLTFSQESHGNITKESGPVSMTFTIPMYNVSQLQ